jgi:hypothetical protein
MTARDAQLLFSVLGCVCAGINYLLHFLLCMGHSPLRLALQSRKPYGTWTPARGICT